MMRNQLIGLWVRKGCSFQLRNCGGAAPVLLRFKLSAGLGFSLPNLSYDTEFPYRHSFYRCTEFANCQAHGTMGRPKRNLLATAAETCSPPTSLDEGHTIARVKKAEGKNLYSVELPSAGEPLLVELPSRFRSQIWIKRGGYVVVDTSAFKDRENKLNGEIINVVRDEKDWRKMPYW